MTSTELRRREPDHRSTADSSHTIWRYGALATLMVAAAFGTGCDTTAKISFPSRSFSSLHSSGMTAPPDVCGSLGQNGNNTTKLRFVMTADDSTAIRPPSKNGRPLDSGEVTMRDGAFTYDSGGSIYEHPDLKCGGEGEQSGEGDTKTWQAAITPYDGTCGNQYSCSVGVSDDDEELKRCRKESSYSVGNVEHVSDVDADQTFGVLMEHSGSLQGFPPGDTMGWFYDSDGDGQAESKVQRESITSTDGSAYRLNALAQLRPAWEDVHDRALDEGRGTSFGLWRFDDRQSTAVSAVGEVTDGESVWSRDPEVVRDAASHAREDWDRTEDGTRGNVLEAANNLIKNQYASSQFDGADKTLVIFTDGPPELHPDRHGVDADTLIQNARDANVRVFMVHLDAPVTGDDPEKVLDDPAYYQDQESQCQGDGDCQPHETCREVRGYNTASVGGEVTGTNGVYHSAGDGAMFCMPERRADGRTGPLSIYAKIACATEGGYQYVKSPTELPWAMRWLPYTMDGLWEADITVTEIERGNFTPNAPIRLQAGFNVKVGDTDVALDLSQTGGDRNATSWPQSGDSRSVVVTGNPDN